MLKTRLMLKKRLLSKSRYLMTLPDERYRNIVQTRKFLMELTSPHMTPKVPKVVRDCARNLLKHYLDNYTLEMMCKDMPEYFAKEIDPVTRIILEYNRDRKNDQTL